MSSKLCLDIIIKDRDFSLIPGKKYIPALETLQRIEKLLHDECQYKCDGRDPRQDLVAKVKELHSIYLGEKSLWSSIDQTAQRIENFLFPSIFLDPLSEDAISKVASFLDIEEVARMALLNRHVYTVTKKILPHRIHRFLKPPHPFNRAENYALSVYRGLKEVTRADDSVKSQVTFIPSSSWFAWFDTPEIQFEKTLENLRRLVKEHNLTLIDSLKKAFFTLGGQGNVDAIRFILESGIDADIKNEEGKTLLLVSSHNLEVVRALLAKQANPKLAGPQDLLGVFHHLEYPDILENLCRHGASLTGALHAAAKQGLVESVRVFLKYKADPKEANQNRNQPIHVAQANPELLTALLEAGADPNALNGAGLPPICLFLSYPKIVELLCKHGASLTGALHVAAEQGLVESVKVLLQYKADPKAVNRSRNHPIHVAHPLPALITALLDAGADPNVPNAAGIPPLCLFIRNPDILELLCKKKAQIGNALHLAAELGLNKAIEILIKFGADINMRNSQGKPPLLVATNPATIKCLLELGANPNMGDTNGFTLLCRDTIDAEMVYLLHCKGANVNQKTTHTGSTPLHYAVKEGNAEKIRALLECGADPTIGDKHGTLPESDVPAIRELLEQQRLLFATKPQTVPKGHGNPSGGAESL